MANKLSLIAEKPKSIFLDFLDEIEDRLTDEAQIERDEIAFKIGYHLRINKLKQKDLAEMTGLKPQQINRILKGKHDFKHSTLHKISKALNIKLINKDIEVKSKENVKVIVMKSFTSEQDTSTNTFIKKEVNSYKPTQC